MTRVALTQPAPRVERIAERLAARGHDALVLSARRLVALGCAGETAPLAGLEAFDWVVFVSPGAVEAALGERDAPWPAAVGIAVIGPGSVQALSEHGLSPPAVRVASPAAPPYDAAALMREPAFARPAGLRILVARGEKGRDDWIEGLRAAGARVEVRTIYRAEPRDPSPEALAALEAWSREAAPVVFVFSSGDGIAAADDLLAARGLGAWARGQPALAVHPRQADALAARGWRRARVIEPGERPLVDAIESA